MVKKSTAASKAKKTSKAKKATGKKTAAKKTAGAKSSEKEEPKAKAPEDVQASPVKSASKTETMTIRMSSALRDKIQSQAEEEGVGADELVKEMLSESVVLRAFDIAERRAGNRVNGNQQQHNHQGGNNQNHGNRQGGRGRFNNNRRGNMSQQRYQNIMDDKASFLEYVRNQERQGR